MRYSILLFIAAFFFQNSSFAILPDPEARFCDIYFSKMLKNVKPEQMLIENQIPISVGKSQTREAFELVETAWESELNIDEMKSLITYMRNGDFSKIDDAAKAFIKRSRTGYNALRISFALFSRDHAFPSEEMEDFVIDYGKLNDALNNNNLEEAQKFARKIYKQLDEIPDADILDDFRPAKRGSFSAHLNAMVKDMKEKLKEDELSGKEYHSIRKAIRSISVYYAVQASLHSEPAVDATYYYLAQINVDMGLVHDSLVTEALSKGVDEKDLKISVSADMKKRIFYFLDHLVIDP